MARSLRKDQIELLKFERQLLSLGAGLATLTAGAAVNAGEVVGDLAADHAGMIQEAYLNLVETVQTAHNAIETSAAAAGAYFMHAGGAPKNATLLEMAKSVIGIG